MKKNITRKKKEKSGDSLREKSDSLKKKKRLQSYPVEILFIKKLTRSCSKKLIDSLFLYYELIVSKRYRRANV